MENVLLVTASKKSADMLIDLIHSSGWHPDRILAAASCSEARRRLIENNVDLIIINAPLTDEFGHEFASYACQNTLSGVLMLVKADLADTVSERVEQDGVVVVTKPISRAVFYQSMHLVNSVRHRIYALQKENRQLRQRLEVSARNQSGKMPAHRRKAHERGRSPFIHREKSDGLPTVQARYCG